MTEIVDVYECKNPSCENDIRLTSQQRKIPAGEWVTLQCPNCKWEDDYLTEIE